MPAMTPEGPGLLVWENGDGRREGAAMKLRGQLAAGAGLLVLIGYLVVQYDTERRNRRLWEALFREDTVTARRLLAQRVTLDLNEKIPGSGLPLVLAAGHGDTRLVQMILARGVDVSAPSWGGERALTAAAAQGDLRSVRLLLQHGAKLEEGGGSGGTALIRASQPGHHTLVRELLGRGARIEARDETGKTALHWAAEIGHLNVVRVLLEHGADVNARDEAGKTALQLARTALAEAIRDERADSHLTVPWRATLPPVIRLLERRTKSARADTL